MNRKNLLSLAACVAGATLFLSSTACVNLQSDTPQKKYYRLQVERTGPARTRIGAVSRVYPFEIAPAFESNRLTYAQSGGAFVRDYYHRFLAAPELMIASATASWLDRSNLFGAVYTEETDVPAESRYVVHGRVEELFGDYTREAPRAVLEVRISVTKRTKQERTPLLRTSYGEQVKLDSETRRSLISGWNQALARILKRLEEDLAAQFPDGQAEG